MSSYMVVAGVSEALRRVLWEVLSADPEVGQLFPSEQDIVFKNPTDTAQDTSNRLSLWLYQITENEFVKNQPMPRANGDDSLQHAPLALDFSYLITPFANAGNVNGIAFTNIENLKGADGDDQFVLSINAELSGVIDGGLGEDTLHGETKDTFELDYEFLKNILDENLLIRRINLRQIIPIPGTKMYHIGSKIISKNKYVFQRFKRKVKENIDRPMLKKILPSGTVLMDVFTEKYVGKLTFGRQLGSYPLLVGIPGIHMLNNFLNVKVVDYGYRSITAVPFPMYVNKVPKETIQAIPGVGQKRALRILSKRPFKDKNQFINSLDDSGIAKKILEYVSFNQ